LQFLLENGKNAPFHMKSPVKDFRGRAKGGLAPCPPLKYATDSYEKTLSRYVVVTQSVLSLQENEI